MSQSYTAQDIEVLSGLEPVRRRPGMYTDTTRPNHLAHEVVDNSVDEALAGHCSRIDVTLYKDGSLEVDRRRSRHAGRHPSEGEGQRCRADPHAPACGRQVLGGVGLQVLRRSARRRRFRRQRALEAPRVLGTSRRQGIQHLVQERQGPLEARGRRRRRQGQYRHDAALLARSLVLRQSRLRGAETQARAEGQGRALPGPARALHAREDGREGGVATTPRALAQYLRESLESAEWLPDDEPFTGKIEGEQEGVDWAVVWRTDGGHALRRKLRQPDSDGPGRHARQRLPPRPDRSGA